MNDIVIVKDDTPRGSWKLAKIVQLNMSRDGLVRSAVVQLGSGRNLVRPLCLLYPLECSDNSSDSITSEHNDAMRDDEFSHYPTDDIPWDPIECFLQTNEGHVEQLVSS